MPNHLHALIDFSATAKKMNTIIGDGKRFMAYKIRTPDLSQSDIIGF
jgi:hypothetical protein